MSVASCVEQANPVLMKKGLTLFSLIEEVAVGALIVDDHARVMWLSETYLAFLGYDDPTPYLNRPVEHLLPQSRMRSVVESGAPHPVDLVQYSRQPLLVTRLPIKDDCGKVIGAIGFAFKDSLAYLRPLMDRIQALQTSLEKAEETLAAQRLAKYTFAHIIGSSPPMIEVRRMAERAAAVGVNVLLLGETGTGKELVAHAIHSASERATKPFVSLNVAAVPDTLVEAELFGVAPGAFTGAGRDQRQGKFELAHKGTLFLDEIGDMPLQTQAKLLRVLQDQEVERLGSNKLIKVDVRIVAATSRNLTQMVEQGSFRSDLFYRLNVLPIRLPPLRERVDDIEPLATHHLARITKDLHRPSLGLTSDALALLKTHDWPGNIRELRNVLEQASLRTDTTILDAPDIRCALPSRPHATLAASPDSSLADTVGMAERAAVLKALADAHGNKAAAARILGITRPNLYAKMSKYGIVSQGETHFA